MIQEISVSSKLLDNLKILYDIIKSKHKKNSNNSHKQQQSEENTANMFYQGQSYLL